MTRSEFLSLLEQRLNGLPQEDLKRSMEYYGEMIDDMTDDGIPEEEAVAAVGDIDGIVDGIISETPLNRLVKERVSSRRRFRAWEIVLLVLGLPVWLPVLLAVLIIVMSLYIVMWSLVISLYSVMVSLGASAVACAVWVFVRLALGTPLQSLLFGGAALAAAGLAIIFLHISNITAKGVLILGKKILVGIKKCFVRKEA